MPRWLGFVWTLPNTLLGLLAGTPHVPAAVLAGRTDPVRPGTERAHATHATGGEDGDDDRLRDRFGPSGRGAPPGARTPARPTVLPAGTAVHPRVPPPRDPVRVPASSDGARGAARGRRDPVIHVGTSGWQYRDWRGAFY